MKGPHFDGHEFIPAALAKGAAGALVQSGREADAQGFRAPGPQAPGKFIVAAGDVLRALGDLAHFWRSRQPARVVAITGSNGKTTTKEMTALILAERFRVLRTEGNLNNLIGLPLMLLRLSTDHEVAVLEMGMNAGGEIRRLTEIADPQVSLITNIGRAHLEFLGDLEGVARTKGELWEKLRKEDWIAVNAEDPRVVALAASAPCQQKTFGIQQKADIQGGDLALEEGKGTQFSLNLEGKKRSVHLATFGRHNVYNALASAALASILGMTVEEMVAGLERFHPFSGRGRILNLGRQVHILDDSYNANPDSLGASLAAFAEMKGKEPGILVIGDMLELGNGSQETHFTAGRRIGKMTFRHLFAIGQQARHLAAGAQAGGMGAERLHAAQNDEEVLEGLTRVIQDGEWILVKGSRGMHLERIIEGLERFLGKA